MKHKQPKKYTLTFFIKTENGNDILEDINCEEWFLITEEDIVYCINEKEDKINCYLKSHLRRVIQHYGIPESPEEITHEKLPEGYN